MVKKITTLQEKIEEKASRHAKNKIVSRYYSEYLEEL